MATESTKAIVSLDPSSTVVGYAVMDYEAWLLEGGLITPANRSAGSYERICSLRSQVRSVLETHQPATMLIEWTKGKVGRRHHGLGAGLAVYGCGVGAIATECEHWCELRRPRGSSDFVVVPVLENTWTRGVSKRARQLAVATECPDYEINADTGADVSDAIGLALWWLKEKRLFGK